jgi:MFS family permease
MASPRLAGQAPSHLGQAWPPVDLSGRLRSAASGSEGASYRVGPWETEELAGDRWTDAVVPWCLRVCCSGVSAHLLPVRIRPPASVLAAALVSSFDRFAVGPLLVVVAADLGDSLTQTAAIASGYFLAYGLSQPLWGVLSDRLGRIRLMRATLVAAAAAGILSAVMPGLGALVAARVLTGAFFGAIVPAALTYVGDTADETHRQPALSDLMAAVALGTALATAAAGVLAQLASWRIVFALPSVVAIGCAVALGRLPEPRRATPAGIATTARQVLGNRWVVVVVTLALVEGAVVLGILTLLAPALQSRGVDASSAGFTVAAYGVSVLLATRVVRVLSRRLPMAALMGVGGTAVVLAYATLALHISVATVLAAGLLLGVTWAFLHSSLQTWATMVLPHARGTVVSLFAAFLFAGSSFAASAAAPLGDHGQWSLLFALASAIALVLTIAAVLAYRAYRHRNRSDRPAGSTTANADM